MIKVAIILLIGQLVKCTNIFLNSQSYVIPSPFGCMDATQDGKYVVACSGLQFYAFRDVGYGLRYFCDNSDSISNIISINISDDGQFIVLVDYQGLLFYRNTGLKFKKIFLISFPGGVTSEVRLTATSNFDYITLSKNSFIKVYKHSNNIWQEIQSLAINGSTYMPTSLATTPYGQYLIISKPSNTTVYKLNSSTTPQQYQFFQNLINSLSFNSMDVSSNWILVGGRNAGVGIGQICIYQFNNTSFELFQVINETNSIVQVAIKSNSLDFASGNIYGVVKQYIKSGRNYYGNDSINKNGTLNTINKVIGLNVGNSNVVVGSGITDLSIYFTCQIAYCIQCYSSNKCSSCTPPSYLKNNKCMCDGNNSISATTGNCVTCNLGNCIRCDSNNTCAQCQTSYILLPNNTCGCTTLSNISTSTGYCISCNITNCLQCDWNNICIKCINGYTVSKVTATCVACSLINCYRCDVNNTCGQCLPSHTISSLTGLCVKCYQQYCIRCDQDNVCKRCETGFTLFLNRQCICQTGNTIVGTTCQYIKPSSSIGMAIFVINIVFFLIIIVYYVVKQILFLKNQKMNEQLETEKNRKQQSDQNQNNKSD